MQEDGRPKVQVIALSKHYGEHDVQALRDISLDIPSGKFVAVMGPSGCGKSTLLNCIGGIDRPTAGRILVDGSDIAQLNEQALTLLRRDKIGFVFQFFNLLTTLTVRENIELPLDLAGKLARDQIKTRSSGLLSAVGLLDRADFYPAQLSGGEMQRVAICRAVVHKPQIILADEPTGNLDTDNGVKILNMLKDLCQSQGETVLMATHSQDAATFADIVVHMKDGRVLTPNLA